MVVIQRIWGDRRKKLVAIGAGVALVAVVTGGLLVTVGASKPSATPTPGISAAISPSDMASPSESPSAEISASPELSASPSDIPSNWVPSDLDGVLAPPELAHRLPMAIMVDDNSVARPQSGFSSASIVIQAMADGGEDRYMMIFQEGSADDIGPVRSARPYFVYWATEYKALFGHFGGDAQSLQQVIPAMAKYIYNEDDLNAGACPYHRVSTRPAPHNAYTNSAVLISCAAKRGYPSTYQNLPLRSFVDPEPSFDRPAAQTISIPYRSGTVGYRYDPLTDSYLRVVNSIVQVDPANNQQLHVFNVVVLYQSYAMVPGLDEMRPAVGNIGSGDAIVFQEGKAIKATWKKSSKTALTRIYTKGGTEIPMVRGQIFIQSVPIGTGVTYQ
jgi:hypothetical protein